MQKRVDSSPAIRTRNNHDSDVRTSMASFRLLGSPVKAPGKPRTEVPTLEFVTITGQPSENRARNSKQVRIHAMRDYIRKSKDSISPAVESIHNDGEEPSTFKGKFKLEIRPQKNKHNSKWRPKPRISQASDSKESLEPLSLSFSSESSSRSNSNHENNELSWKHSPRLVLSIGHGFDPFDTLAFHVGPLSERGLYHYNNTYFMNSVAINPEGNFFMHVREDPALLHSLLYLVTLHHDLQLGISDSRESLYHGAEAFQVISKRLGDERALSDMTIAAVAMLANKENFNGNFDLSRHHIRGLYQMVRNRGGISTLNGLFLRIVTWSDFCFANTWDCQPTFPYQSLHSGRSPQSIATKSMTMPGNSSGANMSILEIINSMRVLSAHLDPRHITTVDRISASTVIYDIEYSLLSMNKNLQDDPEPLYSETLEVFPMKIALHLYLYLVIREIPRLSGGVKRLVFRLQASLELRVSEWWAASSESQAWLLWPLFMGYIASDGQDQKSWFIRHLAITIGMLGIHNHDEFNRHLENIIWQDPFCDGHSRNAWNEIFGLQ